MNFSIRDLLLIKTVAILLVATFCNLHSNTLMAADRLTDGSFWVVSDAYLLDKPRRNAVGTTFVFWKGKLYWATKNGKRGGVYELTLRTAPEETRFTCKDGLGIEGKGILVQDKEFLSIYWNVSDRDYAKIPEPSTAIGKCEFTYRCLPIEKKDALLDLEHAGIRLAE